MQTLTWPPVLEVPLLLKQDRVWDADGGALLLQAPSEGEVLAPCVRAEQALYVALAVHHHVLHVYRPEAHDVLLYSIPALARLPRLPRAVDGARVA